ncbi:LuxR C-terminal-related transcriptional regulator [Actinosynnema sp. NPDC050436]|uniref:LuxR C-terminal-related transcriptional regulator n=1 Tax=Actinosynnema sp. NPDC050436 TaxID=3155659 RepID=UPI0033DE1B98
MPEHELTAAPDAEPVSPPVSPPKLRAPATAPVPVPRDRLLDALDEHTSGAHRPPPLTAVCAPAGAGKTTLLALWVRRLAERRAVDPLAPCPAWVTLDQHDNDPRHLWSAVREALAGAGCAALPPAGAGFPEALIAASDTITTPVCLVLDDVHELTAPDAVRGLALLARHTPDRLRLVIASRTPPPLHLSRLRVEGRLREVRAVELAFTAAEAAVLLGNHGIEPAPDELDVLLRRTEGWAVGLRLAAMSLTTRGRPAFPADDRTVADYLNEEVLDHHPEHVRRFLLSTSVCDAVTPDLAAALSDRCDSGEILDRLDRTNALVSRVDQPGQWYRVHPVLRAFLDGELARTRPPARRRLHRVAAEWHRDHGRPLTALEHALSADHRDLAGDLVERTGLGVVLRGDGDRLHELLGRLPGHLTARPGVALVAATAALEACDVTAADRALERMDESPRLLRSDALRAFHAGVLAQRHRFPDPPPAPSDGLGRPPVGRSGDGDLDVLVLLSHGIAALRRGARTRAEEGLRRALDLALRGGLDYAALHCQVQLAVLAAARGELPLVEERARHAVEFAAERRWAARPAVIMAYVLLGLRSHLRHDRERAARFARLATDHLSEGADTTTGLAARSLHAVVTFDDADDPHAVVAELRRRWGAADDRSVAAPLLAYVAPTAQRMALRVGELGWAVELAERASAALGAGGETALLQAVVQAHRARSGQARRLLEPLLRGEVRAVAATTRVDAWLLEAVLVDRAGDRHRAHEALAKALALAEPLGVVRPFVDAGTPVRDLLGVGVGRFGRLDRFAGSVMPALPAQASGHVDPLTNRELDLLVELPSMRTTEEIADSMYVSVNTVKTHLRGIYRKLGVSQRRDAVVVARQRGLL